MPEITKAKWQQGPYGGWSLRLTPHLEASVHWGIMSERGYVVGLLGHNVKRVFTDVNEAKSCAEREMRRVLEYALARMPEPSVAVEEPNA